MSVYVPVSNVCKFEFIYELHGQFIENVHHYKLATGWNGTKIEMLATNMLSKWHTNAAPCCAPELALISWKGTDLTTQDGASVEQGLTVPDDGTAAGQALPNNVAARITWTTGHRGRSFRGRTYLPGISEQHVAANSMDSSLLALVTTYAEDLLTCTVGSESADLCIVSYWDNKERRTSGLVTTVGYFRVNDIVGTQRRRMPGVGR